MAPFWHRLGEHSLISKSIHKEETNEDNIIHEHMNANQLSFSKLPLAEFVTILSFHSCEKAAMLVVKKIQFCFAEFT